MKTILSFLKLSFLPQSTDVALLFLRLFTAGGMFWLHGMKKVAQFSTLSENFPDPLGVSPTVSLLMAILGEVIGSFLLALGLFTRLAALMGMTTMLVAAALVSPGEEVALLYLSAYVTILIAGGGRFALDPHIRAA